MFFRFRKLFELLCLLVAFMLLLVPPLARAADMLALKAPPPTSRFLTYPVGCGLFYGFNTMGAGGSANGSAIASTQVLAGDVGVTLGYGCPIGTDGQTFWFVDSMFDFSKVNGSDSRVSLGGTATFEQRLAIGAPWSTISALTSMFPELSGIAVPSVPLLPAGAYAGSTNPYAFFALHEQDISAQTLTARGKTWLVSWGVGIGALTRLKNGMVLDTWVEYQAASTGLRLGLAGTDVRLGDSVRVGMSLKL
jgi:hypothetical protein